MEVEFLGFFRCARGTFMRTEQNNQFKKERIYPLQKKRVLDFESSKHKKVSNNGNLKLNTKAFRLVTSVSCWWNHDENISDNIQCFICNQTFESKTDMMGHRKKKHSSIIQRCSKFERGKCRLLVYSQL